MARGLGTVYLKRRTRKDGGTREFYVAQMTVEVDGNRKRIEGQGRTAQAAIDARTRAASRAIEGKIQTPKARPERSGTLTMEMTRWNAEREVSQRTREKAASIIRNNISKEEIGQKQVAAITRVDIAQMLDSRGTQWTKVDTYKSLRAYITHAIDEGTIKTDPMKGIRKPKPPVVRGANSVDMGKAIKRLKALFGWLRRTRWMDDHPMYWARILMALTGMRAGEARGMTWDEVENLTGKGIPQVAKVWQMAVVGGRTQLIRIKNDQPRRVVLYPEAIEALKAWRKLQNGLRRRKTWDPMPGMENLVFTSETGRPLRQQIDDKAWHDLLTEAQKRYKTPVYWQMTYNRKIAISLIRDAGANRNMTAVMMGHSPAVEDKYYYRSALEEQAKAMSLMDQMVKG